MKSDQQFDIVVVGAGGGGMAAAIAAREAGGTVCVVEAGDKVGGTYSYSTGLVWMPGSSVARADGVEDSLAEAERHILLHSGGRADPGVLRVYLEKGPRIIDFLAEKSVPLDWIRNYPDYYAELPGGKTEGRYLSSPVFDPETLPEEWRERLLESPYYTHLPISWREIQDWGGYGTAGSWDQALLAKRREKRIRGFGGATAGYLLKAALAAGVEFRLETEVLDLIPGAGGSIVGVTTRDGAIRASRGVILACGGYEQNLELQHKFDGHAPAIPLTLPTVKGNLITAAIAAGAQFVNMGGQLLAPVFRGDDGAPAFVAREISLPGGIVVNSEGRRFCDDSFYWSLGVGMGRFDPSSCAYANMPSYLVFDQQWKDTYRLAKLAPGATADWLVRGETPEELAQRLGIKDTAVLRQTIDRYNQSASRGEDPEWNRGAKAYSRNSGDPENRPNPCVRDLRGPLYAVRIELGTMGTLSGLSVNADAQVLSADGVGMPGLYACGNAMANLVEGLWYTSGTSNARGLVFGVLSARHAMETLSNA